MMLTNVRGNSQARGLEPKPYVMQAIRKVWLLSKERNEALKNARIGKLYLCAECGNQFPRKQVHVDHIEPIASFVDWNTWIDKLFCETSNLRILCVVCHKAKTKNESRERSELQASQPPTEKDGVDK